jgi:Low affinity iron permease
MCGGAARWPSAYTATNRTWAIPGITKRKNNRPRAPVNNSLLLTQQFSKFAHATSQWTGHPATFLLAVAVVITWVATGPIFGYSDTWQLVINTGTTIVTFLMVFLIQTEP